MKSFALLLGAAVLLAGCNQTAPVSSTPTGPAAPDSTAAAVAPVPPAAAPDSAAAPADATATAAPAGVAAIAVPAGAPAPHEVQTLKMSFSFKPVPNPDDPTHPRTSAHLLLQGTHPQSIDLGRFATRPDVVNVVKAKAANFPSGMLLGFRSYEPTSGISSDLAVMKVDARHLRVVQRRVEETAPEGGTFETAREVSIPENTRIFVSPTAKQ